MSGNSYGQLFKVSTYGESHGEAIGCMIDGCPPNLKIDLEGIQKDLDRRKPGKTRHTSQRRESDTVKILSGVFDGKTTGTPISLIIYNDDARSKDYSEIKDLYRPGHADITYDKKYGVRDYKGGGRQSARETACRVAAGAVAKVVLKKIIGSKFNVVGAKDSVMPFEVLFTGLIINQLYFWAMNQTIIQRALQNVGEDGEFGISDEEKAELLEEMEKLEKLSKENNKNGD